MLKGLAIFTILLLIIVNCAKATAQGTEGQKPSSAASPLGKNTSPSIRADSSARDVQNEPQTVKVILPPKDRYDYIAFGGNLILALVGIVGVIVAIGSLRKIARQADTLDKQANDTKSLAEQALRQSNLTQRQLDLAHRPWISIDSVVPISPLQFKEDGCCIVDFQWKITNVGHSAAQHVFVRIAPIVTGVDNPVNVRERVSTELKQPITSPFDHGNLIFPGQSLTERYPIIIRSEIVRDALNESPFKGPEGRRIPGVGIEIFVCIDYQSTLDTTNHHQTQSMYLLSYADIESRRLMGMFLPDSKKTYSDLVLTFKGFGAYAD